MIVIFGATGKVGGAAAVELRQRGLPVRAVVRDPRKGEALAQQGCAIAVADLYDRAAVERALEGADALLVVCPPRATADDVLADAHRLLDGVATAIDAVRPRAVVAVSDYGAHHAAGTGITRIFHQLERRLGALPVATTFLRSAEHMQNWRRHLGAARDRGILPSLHHPVSRAFPTVSAYDVGRVAAEVLASGGEGPRVIHVEGPRRYSAADVAHVFERLLDRPVVARELARERWEAALAAGGLGASYAGLVAQLQDAHNAGRIDVEAGVGEVRRGATELAEALAECVAARRRRTYPLFDGDLLDAKIGCSGTPAAWAARDPLCAAPSPSARDRDRDFPMRRAILLCAPLLAACVDPASGERLGVARQANVCATGATLEGVDVSVYDGDVDWTQLESSGRASGSRRPRRGRRSRTRSSPRTGRR